MTEVIDQNVYFDYLYSCKKGQQIGEDVILSLDMDLLQCKS